MLVFSVLLWEYVYIFFLKTFHLLVIFAWLSYYIDGYNDDFFLFC